MAILINDVGEYLSRTSNLPGSTTGSLCFWYKPVSSGASYQYLVQFIATQFLGELVMADGWIKIDSSGNGTTEIYGTSALQNGSWYWIELRWNGTTVYGDCLLLADAQSVQTTVRISDTYTTLWLGTNNAHTDYPDGYFSAFKMWSGLLSDAQILAERGYYAAQYATGLLMETKFKSSSVADSSGNGNNWTVTGSPTFSDAAEPSIADGGAPAGTPGSISTTITL
jgi:hypothetical protein